MTVRQSTLFFIAQVVLVVVIVGLGVEKLGLFGIESYVEHLTNWSWTYLGIFLIVTLPYIVPTSAIGCLNVRCAGYMVAACFFPLLLIVSFVMLSVFALLIEDGEFLTVLLEKMQLGAVMFWNDIFHVFPFIVMVFFGFIQFRLVMYGLKLWFVPAKKAGWCALLWLYVYEMFGGMIIIGAYFITLAALGKDVNTIYGTDIPVGAGIGLLVITALLVNGLVLLILTCWHGLLRPSTYPEYDEQRVYKTEEEILGEDKSLLGILKKYEDVPSWQSPTPATKKRMTEPSDDSDEYIF